jgi:hypothetical protein
MKEFSSEELHKKAVLTRSLEQFESDFQGYAIWLDSMGICIFQTKPLGVMG